MIDVFVDFINELYSEISNPQKRVFVGYLLSASLLAFLWLCLVEKLDLREAFHRIFSREIWFSKSSFADFKLLVFNRLFFSATTAAVVSQLTVAKVIYECLHSQTFIQPLILHSLSTNLVAILFTFCFFIVDDFSRFYVHRLMHRVSFLWAFHQVHHSAKTLTPFTIFRTHPVEGLIFLFRTSIVQGFVISTFLFLFGNKVDLVTIFGVSVGVVIFHALGSNLRHSHIKIRYPKLLECIFISPGQHQIHHSVEKRHHNKNFGVALAVWDLMFDSLLHSEKGDCKFGLNTKFGEKQDLIHLYLQPFMQIINTFRSKQKFMERW